MMKSARARKEEVVKASFNRKKVEEQPSSIPVDDIIKCLYEKDELGRIDLSLASMMQRVDRPEFGRYVEGNLLRSSMVQGSHCQDPDVALEGIVPFHLQYGAERQVVAQSVMDKFKSYIEKHKDVE